MRAEFVVQFARDLFALAVLQRKRAFGKLPLVLDRLAERGREVVELATDRSQLRRAPRRHPNIVLPGLDLRHGLRQRLERRQRTADNAPDDQEKYDDDRGTDRELGDDAVPDL